MRASILLIYTGGTIGMKSDPKTGALAPFDFKDIYDELPNLRQLGVDIEVVTFTPIDSSNVTPQLWITLAEMIRDRYAEFDGFVVLHGTDTMSYSASALSFMLKNLSKPIIFTGSQIPMGVMRTDGRENLITAIEIAAARNDNGKAVVPEVCLYFQNRLFRANRTTKYSAEEFSAFHSDNYPALAEVGVNIHYNTASINKPENYNDRLEVNTRMESNVMVVKIFPGISEGLFRQLLNLDGVKGIVMETYGSGNAPTQEWFIEVVSDAIRREVPVVNVSQCSSGSVAMELYQTGIKLQKAGVISGRDSTTEAAVTKLMCLLGLGLTYDDLVKRLQRSIRGEITE